MCYICKPHQPTKLKDFEAQFFRLVEKFKTYPVCTNSTEFATCRERLELIGLCAKRIAYMYCPKELQNNPDFKKALGL